MSAKWSRWLDILQTGFWFTPMLMMTISCGLALALLYVDERVDPGIKTTLPWAYSGGPEGARSLLSTIAGSMITAASVTFSLAAVALSIASQQYGSRVLRNFMRDRITQFLLGTFVSTFIYSVLVVRAVRGSDFSGGFVPSIAVSVAIALSLISLILLIYFVHHVSTSIQASTIVRVIADDLERTIPKLYPSQAGDPFADQAGSPLRGEIGQTDVGIATSGYLQSVDLNQLLAVATHHNLYIELVVKPGDHLLKRHKVARAWGATAIDDEALKHIVDAFIIGGERTPTQDIRYQFQQLTDVIIRALSPGINDPFTATNGIDELASGLSLLSERPRVAEKRQDENGVLRLTVPKPSLAEILEETVGHIAIYGAGDRFVMGGLRRVLEKVEQGERCESETAALMRLREDLDRREQASSMR